MKILPGKITLELGNQVANKIKLLHQAKHINQEIERKYR